MLTSISSATKEKMALMQEGGILVPEKSFTCHTSIDSASSL